MDKSTAERTACKMRRAQTAPDFNSLPSNCGYKCSKAYTCLPNRAPAEQFTRLFAHLRIAASHLPHVAYVESALVTIEPFWFSADALVLQFPRPVFVGADLSKLSLSEALQGTGFDPAKPSLFICEGLLYYLPQV